MTNATIKRMNDQTIKAIANRRKSFCTERIRPYDDRYTIAPTIMADKELWETLYDMVDEQRDDA